jgi:hypothetical protein
MIQKKHIGIHSSLLAAIILLIGVACQPTLVTERSLPTVMVLPSVTPTWTATLTFAPTIMPSATVTPSATITTTSTLTVTPTSQTPTLTRTATPTATSTPRPPLPADFTYGKSVAGRDLLARSFGQGSHLVMLVGGIHTGYEANTVDLVNELSAHFSHSPQDVLPDVMLVLVPVANPDGYAVGRTPTGRFNARRVDLNRNWACDWSPDAVWQHHEVDPGSEPFSEPEAIALAALIYDLHPSVVLFYHAAANGIFAGDCNGGSISETMSAVLGEATGYPYGQPFTEYDVTGTAASWVDGLGIPAADVELTTTQATDFKRNLAGVMALQRWLIEMGE